MIVFLCGDVMTGRGVDQILPSPGDPTLREAVVRDARRYVALAEQVSGAIPAPVDVAWPWGEALASLDEFAPDIRLINLETAITTAADFAPGKAVHYRMHPGNIGCLSVLRPDACVAANNHILDFGRGGLADTLTALADAGINCAGVGLHAAQAQRPAVTALQDGGRVVIFSYGLPSSGVPATWAAGSERPGVAYVADMSDRSADGLADRVLADKRPGDTVIVSLHWGSNWGYEVDAHQTRFAHRLVDAGIDVVHGHSSHHPRPVEVYHGKLILYGCGDLINDYEGIGGYEAFRSDLRLLYFASIDQGSGRLGALSMLPVKVRRMRLELASGAESEWLRSMIEQISRQFGTRVGDAGDGVLTVQM